MISQREPGRQRPYSIPCRSKLLKEAADTTDESVIVCDTGAVRSAVHSNFKQLEAVRKLHYTLLLLLLNRRQRF